MIVVLPARVPFAALLEDVLLHQAQDSEDLAEREIRLMPVAVDDGDELEVELLRSAHSVVTNAFVWIHKGVCSPTYAPATLNS